MISVHTLERLLMLWLLVKTFDTLLTKFMQTAQLTFNGRTITGFFAVLFLFRCREKVRDPPNSPRSVICLDLFLYFLGDTLVLQMGDTVGPRYTAPKISAISYLFRTFSLLIMGDTERPCYTGFCGLSVRYKGYINDDLFIARSIFFPNNGKLKCTFLLPYRNAIDFSPFKF